MQLTVRFDDPELERKIRQLADAEGRSLNRTVIRLLRKATGTAPGREKRDTIGDRLEHLAGTWSEEEFEEFKSATQPFDEIDEELWQ